MKEIDTQRTDEIVCPHCGHEHSASWEFGESGTVECYACEKEFYFEAEFTTYYYSRLIKKDDAHVYF